MPDEPRPIATERDTLTIEETADVYAASGHPRTVRTIQRYSATGRLECVKAPTSLGDKYFVQRDSIARHLAQIEELAALDSRPHASPGYRPPAPEVFVPGLAAWPPALHAGAPAAMLAMARKPPQN